MQFFEYIVLYWPLHWSYIPLSNCLADVLVLIYNTNVRFKCSIFKLAKVAMLRWHSGAIVATFLLYNVQLEIYKIIRLTYATACHSLPQPATACHSLPRPVQHIEHLPRVCPNHTSTLALALAYTYAKELFSGRKRHWNVEPVYNRLRMECLTICKKNNSYIHSFTS